MNFYANGPKLQLKGWVELPKQNCLQRLSNTAAWQVR